VLLLLPTACLSRVTKSVKFMTRGAGWYRVESQLQLAPDGALVPPRAEADDDTPYMDRVKAAFDAQFTQVWVDQETPCLGVVGGDVPPAGTVYLLVHGITGIGKEWMKAIPTLAQTNPAAIYMFRWLYYDERGHILDGLVKGIERFAQCYPKSHLVVLGHSAGGVLLAYAASRITLPSESAGVGFHSEIDLSDDDTHFFNDLGSVRTGYPAAAPSVFVTHLRTQFPADHVMEPNRSGYAPNAITAVVKGARLIDVPATLGHDESLLWAVQQLAAGTLP
jgi:hypothetical protein